MAVTPTTEADAPAPATPPLTPPWDRRRVSLAAIVVAAVVGLGLSSGHVGLRPHTLIDGLGAIGSIFRRAWPPRWDDFAFDLRQGWLSFMMAVTATAIAAVLSFPLALLAARNTAPNRVVGTLARAAIILLRAIPGLVLALIFVSALQIGPLPGTLGLGLHSVGMVAKLLADAIEESDPGPADAFRSAGAGRLQTALGAVVPQVVPGLASVLLYRLEINMRDSAVVGLVGGGGIGFLLQSTLQTDRWPTSFGLILIIIGYVLVIEQIGSQTRKRLLAPPAPAVGGQPTRAEPGLGTDGQTATTPPWTAGRVTARFGAVALLAFVGYCCTRVELTPAALARGLPKLTRVTGQLLTPDLSHLGTLVNELVMTVEIGAVGTALGLLLAVPVSLLAARNVAPAAWVTHVARYVLVVVRAVPELAIAVVFVAAVGLGPFAGVLALAVVAFWFGAKLLADDLELEDPGPREAATATGANRFQQVWATTVPAQLPALVGACLYDFDIALRTSTVLGVVGAGGVGYGLDSSIRTLHYHVAGAYLLGIFVLVYGVELVAARIRHLLI